MGISQDFLKKYDFDWEVLEVIVGGQSAIDSPQPLKIKALDEAVRFMECYGFDIENPIEKAELFGNFQEAMSFMMSPCAFVRLSGRSQFIFSH